MYICEELYCVLYNTQKRNLSQIYIYRYAMNISPLKKQFLAKL